MVCFLLFFVVSCCLFTFLSESQSRDNVPRCGVQNLNNYKQIFGKTLIVGVSDSEMPR